MNHFYFIILTLTVFVGLSACSEVEKPFDNDQTITSSYEKPTSIDSQRLSNIVKVLASDEFEGRAPGGPGEAKTIEFLIDQFQSLGLEPGGTVGLGRTLCPLYTLSWQLMVA